MKNETIASCDPFHRQETTDGKVFCAFVALIARMTIEKTHSYRLYQKLGVHSQQELIDLVEAEKSALPR